MRKSRMTLGRIERREGLQGYLYILPWIIGFGAFTAYPVFTSLYMSFNSWTMTSRPYWVGLRNYVQVLTEDPLFLKSLGNTFYYTFISVPLSVAGALCLALIMNNERRRGIFAFRTIYYLPAVLPVVSSAVIWIWLLQPKYGLVNRFIALFGLRGPNWLYDELWSKPAIILMSLWTVGSQMIIFLAGLKNVPKSLYEAVLLDGANAWQKFWRVTVPLISPTIFFATIMGFIGSFQVFTQAFVLTGGPIQGQEGGPNNSTLFYVLYLYKTAFQKFRMGYASALAWILFAIILVFTLVQFVVGRKWVYYESEKPR